MGSPVIAWSDVINVAPETSAVPTASQTAILTAVGNQVNSNQWGAGQANGQAWLAAHLATLWRRRGEGPTGSKSAGGLSQSFTSMMDFGALGMTSYGVEYSRLVELLPTVRMGFVP